MLGLLYDTPPEWAQRALTNPSQLMLDHLFCERKAAAMALHTLRAHGARFPKLKQLMKELAAEEFEHAGRCEGFLKELPKVAPEKGGNPYAQGLRKLWNVRGRDTFLDMLLVFSLIEARSAERFKLLADTADGTALGRFYGELYSSEVNHYVLFVELGKEFFGEAATEQRLHEMRLAEADLIRAQTPGSRIHSGG